jgi:hypothetical protein
MTDVIHEFTQVVFHETTAITTNPETVENHGPGNGRFMVAVVGDSFP